MKLVWKSEYLYNPSWLPFTNSFSKLVFFIYFPSMALNVLFDLFQITPFQNMYINIVNICHGSCQMNLKNRNFFDGYETYYLTMQNKYRQKSNINSIQFNSTQFNITFISIKAIYSHKSHKNHYGLQVTCVFQPSNPKLKTNLWLQILSGSMESYWSTSSCIESQTLSNVTSCHWCSNPKQN